MSLMAKQLIHWDKVNKLNHTIMHIQLLQGEFKSTDAIELITQMINVKIKFHENKINKSELEEDIKAREVKIKRLQKDLSELRNNIGNSAEGVKLNSIIQIN